LLKGPEGTLFYLSGKAQKANKKKIRKACGRKKEETSGKAKK